MAKEKKGARFNWRFWLNSVSWAFLLASTAVAARAVSFRSIVPVWGGGCKG